MLVLRSLVSSGSDCSGVPSSPGPEPGLYQRVSTDTERVRKPLVGAGWVGDVQHCVLEHGEGS